MSQHLPADVARCPGVGDHDTWGWEWREGCQNCRRRTDPYRSEMPPIVPESIIAFECHWRIGPDEFQSPQGGEAQP